MLPAGAKSGISLEVSGLISMSRARGFRITAAAGNRYAIGGFESDRRKHEKKIFGCRSVGCALG
jgi:hypothetical protein